MGWPLAITAALGAFGAKKQADANKEAVASQNAANKANLPENQVASWEKAGINPLVGVTQGQWIPQRGHQPMSDPWANFANNMAGSVVDYYQAEKQFSLEKTRIKQESQHMAKKIRLLEKYAEPSNMQKYGGFIPSTIPAVSVRNASSGSSVHPVDGNSSSDNRSGGSAVVKPDFQGLVNTDGTHSADDMKKYDRPFFRAFGIDFQGTGRFSSAETFEDSAGELIAWPMGVVSAVDAVTSHVGRSLAEDYVNPALERRKMRKIYKNVYSSRLQRKVSRVPYSESDVRREYYLNRNYQGNAF